MHCEFVSEIWEWMHSFFYASRIREYSSGRLTYALSPLSRLSTLAYHSASCLHTPGLYSSEAVDLICTTYIQSSVYCTQKLPSLSMYHLTDFGLSCMCWSHHRLTLNFCSNLTLLTEYLLRLVF